VESSCKLGNEPLGSIKCWDLPNGCTTCGLSSNTQLHRVSWLVIGFSYILYGTCFNMLFIVAISFFLLLLLDRY
jgi:hypothetical protein